MKNHMTQENYKAILVPMGKEGWSEGDILKCTSFDNISAEEKDLNAIAIAKSDNPYAALCWQAQKLIIVNTKAEIKEEDWIFDSDYKSVEKAVRTPESKQDPNYILCSKIISSYPSLPNIPELPLQFVQDYVNSGEGCRVKVEMEPCCEVNCTGECVSNKSHWKYEINPDNTLAISLVKEEKPKQRCKECGLWMYPKDGLRLEYCHDCSLNTNDGWQQSDNIDNAGKEDEDIKLTKQVAIENGKVVRIYSPEWAKSGRLDPEDLLKYVIATFKQREHLVAYVSVLHDKIDELLSTTPATSPVDVEQMAKEYADEKHSPNDDEPRHIVADSDLNANSYMDFKAGYNANKGFSEEDMKREAIKFSNFTIDYYKDFSNNVIPDDELYNIFKKEKK